MNEFDSTARQSSADQSVSAAPFDSPCLETGSGHYGLAQVTQSQKAETGAMTGVTVVGISSGSNALPVVPPNLDPPLSKGHPTRRFINPRATHSIAPLRRPCAASSRRQRRGERRSSYAVSELRRLGLLNRHHRCAPESRWSLSPVPAELAELNGHIHFIGRRLTRFIRLLDRSQGTPSRKERFLEALLMITRMQPETTCSHSGWPSFPLG